MSSKLQPPEPALCVQGHSGAVKEPAQLEYQHSSSTRAGALGGISLGPALSKNTELASTGPLIGAQNGENDVRQSQALQPQPSGALSTSFNRNTLSCPGPSRPSSEKFLSFRSSSVISQSTPLKFDKPSSLQTLSQPATDELTTFGSQQRVIATLSAPPASDALPSNKFERFTSGSEPSQHNPENDAMSQLASQLSQLVLSPCLHPVTSVESPDSVDSECLDLDEQLSQNSITTDTEADLETKLVPRRITRSSLTPRSKTRATSISFGYIPSAFPEVLDDLQLVFDSDA